MSMTLSKPQLRKTMRQVVGAMTGAERAAANARLCGHLRAFIKNNRPGLLLAFFATGHEPEIGSAIGEALSAGIPVALPAGAPEGMVFRLHGGTQCLRPGRWGLPEPVDACPQVGDGEIGSDALILVPGLAFTRLGQRLGRGGGHYDRFLARHPQVCSVGVCYGVQVVEELPAQEWDRCVRWLCTEHGVVAAGAGKSG